MALERILAVAKKHSYFSRLPSKSNNNVYNFKLGDLGLILHNNIKNHWLSSNVSKNTRVFDHTKNTHNQNVFCDSFKTTSNFHKKLPSNMIEFYKTDSNEYSNSDSSIKFSFPSYTILSLTKFLTPHDSMQYFFNLQRERKLWWKKVSFFSSKA